jgi:hypothetical protein
MDMNLKEAVLGYLRVLGVPEYNDKLSPEERKIGAGHIMGCLSAIEDRLSEVGDPASLSLVDTIKEREHINGRIYDVKDSRLVTSTKQCAQEVFDYYVERCRSAKTG